MEADVDRVNPKSYEAFGSLKETFDSLVGRTSYAVQKLTAACGGSELSIAGGMQV